MRSPPSQLNFTGAAWPTPPQALLLRGCLATDPTAIDAWRAWQKQVVFDDIDLATLRLVPLLYHNLSKLGVDDSSLGRYAGIRRKHWYSNQLLFQEAAATLALFRAAGIPTLMLKGVPLAHLYYPGIALRPMSDFDVLVPMDRASQALAILVDAGWNGDMAWAYLYKRPPHFSHGRHSWDFKNAAGHMIDLHWRALKINLAPGAEDHLWQGAEKFHFANTETLTLNATDHLLNVCLHGLPINRIPSMRWVADAIMILRSRPIDWDRLVTEIQFHRATVMMHHALAYLRQFFDAPVPDQVLSRIAALPVERWEHLEFLAIVNDHRAAWRLRIWLYNFLRFRRTMPPRPRSPFGTYMDFWLMRWELEHPREIPAAAWDRLSWWMRHEHKRLFR